MAVLKNYRLMIMIAVMALIVLLMVYVFKFPKYHANQVMSTYFSFIYAPVLFSFVYLTRQLEYGIYFVFTLVRFDTTTAEELLDLSFCLFLNDKIDSA